MKLFFTTAVIGIANSMRLTAEQGCVTTENIDGCIANWDDDVCMPFLALEPCEGVNPPEFEDLPAEIQRKLGAQMNPEWLYDSTPCMGPADACLWEASGCDPEACATDPSCAKNTLADMGSSPAMPLIQEISSGGTANQNAQLGQFLEGLKVCAGV